MPAKRAASALCRALFAAGSLTAIPASAAALKVTPVSIRLESAQRFCALTITNDDDKPVILQVRGFGWSRDADGNDHFDPDAGVAVNPSILTLKPREDGLVRCSLPARDSAGQHEESWRMIVDELPDPTATQRPGVIRTRLRLSLPVFRAPADAQPQLVWRPAANGVEIVNTGTRHAKLLGVTFREMINGGVKQSAEQSAYLLPGGSARIVGPARFTSIEALTDEGPLVVTRDDALRIAGR